MPEMCYSEIVTINVNQGVQPENVPVKRQTASAVKCASACGAQFVRTHPEKAVMRIR